MVLIVAFAALGLYISAYFTLLTYRVIDATAAWVPRVCRLDEGACTAVIDTRAARLIGGVPNALFGVAYYVVLFVVALGGGLTKPGVVVPLAFVSLLTVVMAMYLLYELYVVMRVSCILCVIAHGANVLLAVLLFGRVPPVWSDFIALFAS